MRTTLTIADDVLAAVRERARRENRTVGAVLSDLARRALQGHGGGDHIAPRHGFAPFPPRGELVSNEVIDQLREQEGV